METPVVLINPPAEKIIEEHDAPSFGHVGLAYLGSALKMHGYDCVIIDAKLARLDYITVIEYILKLKPRIVGITSYTHEINNAVKLASEIKKSIMDVKIVIGGVHASLLPVETLQNFSCFDFLIQGEAEYTFVKLVDAIINDKMDVIYKIPGIGYRSNGDIFFARRNDWIINLDTLSFPAWDLFPKMKIFPVVSSRGCPHKCVFCTQILGNNIRVRSPENVVEELRMLQERFEAKRIRFYEATFGFHKDWLIRLSDLIVSSGLHQKITWEMATRAQILNPEILQRLKKAGCTKIDFGVESGNEGILKIIRKGETKEDFVKATRFVKKAGIKSHAYYILGHPYETKKTAEDTINFAVRLNTNYISIGIMIPFPGTEVARLASKGEGGYKKISFDWTDYNKQLGDALELESISRAELTKLQLLGYFKFYIKNFKFVSLFAESLKYRRLIFKIISKYFKQVKKN